MGYQPPVYGPDLRRRGWGALSRANARLVEHSSPCLSEAPCHMPHIHKFVEL